MTHGSAPGVLTGFGAGVLSRVHSPEIGLVIWHRFTRLNLQVTAASLRAAAPFTMIAEGPPEIAARLLYRELSMAHWPFYADIRRLGVRFVETTGCTTVRLRLEHVVDDACRRFHVDAVGLRLLCTYSGSGTEWIGADGQIRRMKAMEVAIFKGSSFPVPGPRILHRSPSLQNRPPSNRSRIILCIDEGV
jgi:hypothetical protein